MSAVNSVSPVVRNVTEIKKKRFDMKMALKNAMARRSMTATKAVQSVAASSWWHFDGAVHEEGVVCLG